MQDILANAAAKQARNTETGQKSSVDASLRSDYTALIKQALIASEDDKERVEKAKELIRTGQLETRDNIMLAAQNIIQYGI